MWKSLFRKALRRPAKRCPKIHRCIWLAVPPSVDSLELLTGKQFFLHHQLRVRFKDLGRWIRIYWTCFAVGLLIVDSTVASSTTWLRCKCFAEVATHMETFASVSEKVSQKERLQNNKSVPEKYRWQHWKKNNWMWKNQTVSLHYIPLLWTFDILTVRSGSHWFCDQIDLVPVWVIGIKCFSGHNCGLPRAWKVY